MESHRQKSLGENSDKQLLSAPGFRGAAVVAVEMEQGAVREAGTASSSCRAVQIWPPPQCRNY